MLNPLYFYQFHFNMGMLSIWCYISYMVLWYLCIAKYETIAGAKKVNFGPIRRGLSPSITMLIPERTPNYAIIKWKIGRSVYGFLWNEYIIIILSDFVKIFHSPQSMSEHVLWLTTYPHKHLIKFHLVTTHIYLSRIWLKLNHPKDDSDDVIVVQFNHVLVYASHHGYVFATYLCSKIHIVLWYCKDHAKKIELSFN